MSGKTPFFLLAGLVAGAAYAAPPVVMDDFEQNLEQNWKSLGEYWKTTATAGSGKQAIQRVLYANTPASKKPSTLKSQNLYPVPQGEFGFSIQCAGGDADGSAIRQALIIEFFDAKKKNDHGRMGRPISVRFVDNKPAPIEKYGFSVIGFKEKREVAKQKGGMYGAKDGSEVTLKREDGKIITLAMSENREAAPRDQDLEATLVFERGGTKEFKVVEGSEIELHGSKYTIAKITNAAKGGKANVEVVDALGKKRVIEALEQ